jgi:hypothetical protein
MAGLRKPGIRFLELGEIWRNEWIAGKSITEISHQESQHPQTIRRAIWLARIPEDVKNQIKLYPEVFTRQILLDIFAAKRKQCEKEEFKLLKKEVDNLIKSGSNAKPVLKRTNKISKKKIIQKDVQTNPVYYLEDALSAEQKIKNKFKTHCRVSFEKTGAGEIRIFFESKHDLNKILTILS